MTKSIIDKKKAYTLAEKLDIVKEAYHEDGTTSVKQAAKKFSIQPQQIWS
jgi:transposase-like protein